VRSWKTLAETRTRVLKILVVAAFVFVIAGYLGGYYQGLSEVQPERKDWICHMQIDYNKQVSTGDFNFVIKTFDLTLPCGEFEVRNLFVNAK